MASLKAWLRSGASSLPVAAAPLAPLITLYTDLGGVAKGLGLGLGPL